MREQVLFLSHLAASRSRLLEFAPSNVVDLFAAFRLPAPSNVSTYLARLRDAKLVTQLASRRWVVTPLGEARLQDDLVRDTPQLTAALRHLDGATFARERHLPASPVLAPQELQRALAEMLKRYAFETNVFLITRYPREGEDDPLREGIDRMRQACASHGLRLLVASDGAVDNSLWHSVATYLWGSLYCVAVLDDKGGDLNQNVLIELGAALALGRRSALLKDRGVGRLPTDLVGQIHIEVDTSDAAALEKAIHSWAFSDLGLTDCDVCAGAQDDQVA
jgi:hypothetical protein